MGYSKLVSYIKISPNKTKGRNHDIDTISIHCMAGNLSIESCGELFQNTDPKKAASSNYGIGSDGRIACYVDEDDRSWCTSSSSNDNRAITIEIANTVAKHPWPVSDAAYNSLINLLVDICQRNGIKRLLWKADKSLIGQVDKQNMTVHHWFANKACPGDWLYSRHGQIADAVNKRLECEVENMTKAEFIESLTPEEALAIQNKARQALRASDGSSGMKSNMDWAVAEGLFVGNEKGELMPRDFLTREQFATVLHRYDEKR